MLRSLGREFKFLGTNYSRFYSTNVIGGGGGGGARRLEGKVALITGSASGLGKATAHQFVEQGAQVIIADIDANGGSQVAIELGPAAHFVQCDVADESQIEEAVNFAINHHGKLDIMYNNAGIIGPVGSPSITDLDLNEFDRVMRINVRGMVAGIKHAARVMIPLGSGSILCTSSICGLMGGFGPHQYTISKFTIPGIVKSMASELCRAGVRINCISPGPIATPMSLAGVRPFFPDLNQEQMVAIVNGFSELAGAKCEEIDVAQAALYLASDEAKYITGHNLIVDGGLTSFKNLAFPSLDQTA
ncbi:Short-chain dehydrogenase reductase [Quillaja saponaria]|uniref:Short-chain dehydrogenase reductase n=1 Tax=Quillaja saponaria TaxID=32244 RepID=A0AAD7PZ20_QUISA|nr:Short-chain dehydrogenase reductase [Quillaja saponaria]